jgi:hypothetical protein
VEVVGWEVRYIFFFLLDWIGFTQGTRIYIFFCILKLTDVNSFIAGSCIIGMFQGKDLFMFSFRPVESAREFLVVLRHNET